MKVLVAVKRVADPNVKVHVRSDKSGLELSHVKMTMNPFDEIAVEEALRLREAGAVEEVILVTVGPSQAREMLRMGLAMGADRAIHVVTDQRVEPLAVAKLLKQVGVNVEAELIMLGKQAIDDDANQTGQMLAGLLNWPQATCASRVALNGLTARVTRETDRGRETLEVMLPTVMTVDLALNEPRFASLPNIMKAKKKPIEEIAPDALGVDLTPRVLVHEVAEPPLRASGRIVNSVDELLAQLKEEARVL